MAEINSDADVDTLIWSTLQGSTCAQDYLDFIRHASGRPAPYEEAFMLAERYWRPFDEAEAAQLIPSKFPEFIAEVQAQADGGNPVAMLHLGQFFTKGIGMKADETTGQAWLRRGADLGNADCMILLGHSLRKTDWTAAREVLEHAVSLGHDFAHLELAEIDPQRRLYHLEQALKSENPYVYALYGEHLVKQSQTEKEKAVESPGIDVPQPRRPPEAVNARLTEDIFCEARQPFAHPASAICRERRPPGADVSPESIRKGCRREAEQHIHQPDIADVPVNFTRRDQATPPALEPLLAKHPEPMRKLPPPIFISGKMLGAFRLAGKWEVMAPHARQTIAILRQLYRG